MCDEFGTDFCIFAWGYLISVTLITILYFWMAWKISKKVYIKTQSLSKKRIIFAIFLLIPTLDVLIEYPIFSYLCKTQSGVKIYKTVDNTEGFYIVGTENHSIKDILKIPYDGFRFIDYKIKNKNSNQYVYYRDSWVDANTTNRCEPINYTFDNPTIQLYAKGKCIVHNEINESDVSPYEYIDDPKPQILHKFKFLPIQINSLSKVVDRNSKKSIGEYIEVSWQGGWAYNFFNMQHGEYEWSFRCPDRGEEISTVDFLHTVLMQNN